MPTPSDYTPGQTGPTNPAYGPTEGTNYYVPGRGDVVQPGGSLPSGHTAYNNVIAGTDYGGLNQHMQRAAEYFDPFIQRDTIAYPSWWRDRIPKGQHQFFRGLSAETRIFRGGLPHMAGLSDFEVITDNPGDGVCTIDDYKTVSYGWERLEWFGYRRTWGSEPICLDTLVYTPQAKEQLAWIMQVGADFGTSIQESWNRDMYVHKSVVFGNSFIMNHAHDGSPLTSPRYFYDPFVKAANVTDADTKAMLNSTPSRPFIVFPADSKVEPLNFDVLDLTHELLSVNTKGSAIGNAGGQSLFGLPTSFQDFEKFVRGSQYHLANWREAHPEKLIEGYDLGVKNFRGWAISNDSNQLRFKIGKYVPSYSSAQFGGVGSDLDGQGVYVAYYTPPVVVSQHRIGERGGPIPEANPDYIKAEVAIAPVFMNNVYANYFESAMPNSLGSNTSFGPRPGLNGLWSWINYASDTNPKGSTGRFIGEYRIHPKPMMGVFNATSFLYRRCTEPIESICPIDNWYVAPNTQDEQSVRSVSNLTVPGSDASDSGDALEAVEAANDGFVSIVKLSGALKGAGPGALINVEVGGNALLGVVMESGQAPTYVVAFKGTNFTTPTEAEGTGIGFCEDSGDAAFGKLCSWVTTLGSDSTFSTAYTALAVVPATDDATLA